MPEVDDNQKVLYDYGRFLGREEWILSIPLPTADRGHGDRHCGKPTNSSRV